MKKLLLLPLVFAASASLAQPTQYITDKLYAPVRSEAGEKGKLLHNGLESGTAITVLENNDKSGYARIRTSENLEGWVRTQYLSSEPPVSVQLEQANAQIAQLQAEKAQLEEQLVAIKQISSSQIDTHQRNAELVKQNQLLIGEKEVLQTDNERLKDRNDQTWFLYGGLLVALSAIVAALIPRLGKKRRYDGWA
jgi:SH3 domain protein